MSPTIRWSASQSDAWTCPLRWYMRYRAQLPSGLPGGEPMRRRRGTAEHAALEAAYRAAARDSTWERGVTMARHAETATEKHTASWGTRDDDHERDRSLDTVLALLDTLPAPVPRSVLGVEQRALVPLATDDFTVELAVVLDLLLGTGHDTVHVRDWKHDTIGDPGESLQLGGYDAAARALHPGCEVTVGLYSVVRRRENTAALTAEQREHARDTFLHHAAQALDGIDDLAVHLPPVVAFPPNPAPDRCGGCPFRSYCPETADAHWPVADGIDVATHRAHLITPGGTATG